MAGNYIDDKKISEKEIIERANSVLICTLENGLTVRCINIILNLCTLLTFTLENELSEMHWVSFLLGEPLGEYHKIETI